MLAALASSALEVLRPTDSRGAAIFWNHMAACGDAQDAWTMMRRHRTFTAR
jgi:cystathionine beta-lyase/cystathionine gamma-synthase